MSTEQPTKIRLRFKGGDWREYLAPPPITDADLKSRHDLTATKKAIPKPEPARPALAPVEPSASDPVLFGYTERVEKAVRWGLSLQERGAGLTGLADTVALAHAHNLTEARLTALEKALTKAELSLLKQETEQAQINNLPIPSSLHQRREQIEKALSAMDAPDVEKGGLSIGKQPNLAAIAAPGKQMAKHAQGLVHAIGRLAALHMAGKLQPQHIESLHDVASHAEKLAAPEMSEPSESGGLGEAAEVAEAAE